jgi:hypothetical protein
MAHDEAFEANGPFEEMLRSMRPIAPTNAEVTFYEAGRQAALCEMQSSETGRWKHQSFPAFASGMVAGLVAAVVVFAGFVANTTPARTDQVQQAVVPAPHESPLTNELASNAKDQDIRRTGLDTPVTREKETVSSRLVVVDWLSRWIGRSHDDRPISSQRTTLISHGHPFSQNEPYLGGPDIQDDRPFVGPHLRGGQFVVGPHLRGGQFVVGPHLRGGQAIAGPTDQDTDSYKVLRYQPLKPDAISDFF